MGTRNSTLIQVDGEYKVAQYCQWDGYPSGQGIGILESLRNSNLQKLRENVSSLESISEGEIRNLWEGLGADDSGFVTLDISKKFQETYPHLHRNCGGSDIIPLIESGNVKSVFLDTEFPKDSLFCEWCYVVDFDKNTFEVYKGFNTEPLNEGERFFVDPSSLKERDTKYYPVKLLASFDLSNLPTRTEFFEKVEPKEESED
jgi:hypothetical protein